MSLDRRNFLNGGGGPPGITSVSSRIQIHGVLLKKPFGHPSNKWSKRFFVVKDGFLLYYPESEKKEFERKRYFNIHPKGVIPLGGCSILPVQDQYQSFAIHVTHPEFEGTLCLAADSEFTREKWLNILRESGRITWLNQRLGDNMIQELESQGLQLCKEKEEYHHRLQYEAIALRDEIDKNEALQRIARELEEEKKEIAMIMQELQTEYDTVKCELEETVLSMKGLEDDSRKMQFLNGKLQKDLECLSRERENTLFELNTQQMMAEKLSKENHSLSQCSDRLKRALGSIEDRIKQVTAQKLATEQNIRKNAARAELLKEEKENCRETAEDIMVSLKNLIKEKELTEQELKEEVMARLAAEKRLTDAEDSLSKLDRSLRENSTNIHHTVKRNMISNVQLLKKFFEDLADDSRTDVKQSMVKNAINTHKSFVRRAKSLRIATLRKSRAKTGESPLFCMFKSTVSRQGGHYSNTSNQIHI